eukprot:6780135-Pyramimonas_sp.AAC.1
MLLSAAAVSKPKRGLDKQNSTTTKGNDPMKIMDSFRRLKEGENGDTAAALEYQRRDLKQRPKADSQGEGRDARDSMASGDMKAS